MNRKLHKLTILMLTFLLMFPVTTLADVSEAELRDIRGHWAQEEITRLFQKGLVKGYRDGTFRPDAAISRIEFVILVNRIFQFTSTAELPFTDIDRAYQYYSEISKAFANRYIKGYPDGTFRPNQPITREEAAVILAGAFHLQPSDVPVTALSDVESLGAWSRGAVRALVHAGVLKGYPDGTFRANQPISRAETVKLLMEISGEVLNQPGTYSDIHARNVVINTPGVVLKDSVIEGDLYLTEGIGEGDVTLQQVTVRGTVRVAGGGANSVHMIDSSIANIVVDKRTGIVRISIEGESNVGQVFVITGVRIETDVDEAGAVVEKIILDERMIEDAIVELSGSIGTVEVRALTEPEIKLLSGIIEQLVAEQKVKIHVDETGQINDLLNLTDDDISVTGDGKVTVNPDSKGNVDTGSEPSAPAAPSPGTPNQPTNPTQPQEPEEPEEPATPVFQNVSVHDPSIIVADGKYYVFGTHIEAARSDDLMRWTRFTNGYTTPGNALFGDLSANLAGSFAWAGEDDADSKGGYSVWAPDVIWVENYDNGDGTTGAYLMYYSVSSTYIRSAIGIAASKSIEGPYEYVDTIIYSGFTNQEAYDANSDVNKHWSNTNLQRLIDEEIIQGVRPGWFNSSGGYNNSLFPNAIDPTLFYDKNGTLWMTYGSWSGGIFLLEIDPTTGRPIYPGEDGETEDGRLIDRYFGIKIAGGYAKSGEGPYIFYDPTTDTYYLFVTYGRLDSNGEYNMRLFRAEKPEGPYLDASGQNAVLPGNVSNEPYGNKLIGHFMIERLPGESGSLSSWGYVSPGHNSAYLDPDSGQYFLFFHSRFPFRGEAHEVRVHQMFLNEDNWLVVSPYRYAGETLQPVSEAEIAGEYRYLNHGKQNTVNIQKPTYITLHEDHTITSGSTGEQLGTWSKNGDHYAELTIGGKQFKGVFVRGWDPIAERFEMTFTALSDQGENIWGMRYAGLLTDEEILDAIIADLELGETTNLTWDLQLPQLGMKGTVIEWLSSDESVITSDGKITRPEAGSPPAVATLTATVKRGSETRTKSFHITVKPLLIATLVANYTMDGDLADDLGNYAAGTITGNRINNTGGQITFTNGVVAQAAVFDGNSGVRLPDGLVESYEYSVSLWLKPDQLTNFTTSFFGARDTANWVSLNPHGWSNTAMLWSGERWYDAVSDVVLPIGEWSHLAFTVQNGDVHLYVNGELKFSGTDFPHIFNTSNAAFALGVNYWDLPFKGLIDDLRIYEGALTAAEVEAMIVQPGAEVEKIVITPSEVELFIGEVYLPANVKVYPIYAPDRSLTWSSSDESAATVDPETGHVQGIAEGTAEIIATAQDGSGVTASYTVTVKPGKLEPIAYYSFDSTLEDAITGEVASITGNRPNNTGGTITYAAGTRGQAAVFDGNSGILLRDDLITGNEYTVTMSVYMDAANRTDYTYSSAFFGAHATNSWISFTPVGHPDVQTNSTLWSGEAWYVPNTGVQIANRTWADVAFTVNNGQIQIYINGEIVYSGSNFPNVFRGDAAVFTLGVNYWDKPFRGMIDELRIYNKALNKETIDQIFQESKMPEPVAHFTFDAHLEDVAAGGRSATVIGVERNAADTAYDFGPTFGHGVITFDTGVRGQAAVFDGASGLMLPGGLIQSARYSVSMWLNPSQITRYTTTFFAAIDGENWVSFLPEGFQGDAMLWSNRSGSWYDGHTGMTIPVNQWTHVVFTVDGGQVRVYLNGELKHEGANFNDVFSGKHPFYTLGVNWWDAPYQGMIDDLRIYDAPLNDVDVLELYNLRR